MKKDVLIYFDLITSLKTVQEVDGLSLQIDTLMSALFNTSKMSLDPFGKSFDRELRSSIPRLRFEEPNRLRVKPELIEWLDKALSSINQTLAKKITEIFEKNNLDMTDRDNVRYFLDTLKDLIKKFKVIKLTLAFDPTPKTIDNIHEFVSENIGIGYILDIEVLEGVYGGAAIMFNGKYKDFTLKKTLEDVFADKSEEILKLIQ